jgi:hypothetical protein
MAWALKDGITDLILDLEVDVVTLVLALLVLFLGHGVRRGGSGGQARWGVLAIVKGAREHRGHQDLGFGVCGVGARVISGRA